MDSEMDAQEMTGAISDESVLPLIEGESMMEEESKDGSMYQIRENDDELNNSFENIRKTNAHKRQKSLDDCDGTEESTNNNK